MNKPIVEFPPEFEQALREYLSYDPESGIMRWIKPRQKIKVGAEVGSFDAKGYRQMGFMGRVVKVHRIAWFLYYGTWPIEIDHWDTNKANNAIYNLRDIDHQTNIENRIRSYANNKLGLLGASFEKDRGTFRAQIKVNGHVKVLGHFKTANEAHFAYIEAKRELHHVA